MRLFIIFIFLTFVVLQNVNAAPQSTPIKSSPIDDKSVLKQATDDYYPPAQKQTLKMQIGAISGSFGDSETRSWHYLIGAFKKTEFAFERNLVWGISLASNKAAELRLQASLSSLFQFDPTWDGYGIGISQFVWGQDGISNLVNINQTKLTGYADVGEYFQFQLYYGLKGLAYSISFQNWF